MFRNWVLENFPYIEDDFDALTDYELFSKICGYVLEYSKDNEEMKKKIEELENYFKNLDVQEEIDNKLDEMALDGTLAEIINEEIFSDLNNKVDFNLSHNLVDNVQAILRDDIDTSNIFTSDWAVTSVIIIGDKGVIIANDWTESGSGGEKFDIKTFDYENGIITNVETREHLLDGHSSSMCKIDDSHVLIVAQDHHYVFDIDNNITTPVTLPYSFFCCDHEGDVYCGCDYDWSTSTEVNKLYKLSFDESYTPTIVEQKTIPNLREKLQGNEQGAVIYKGFLIFPSFSNCKLCIYDFETLTYLRTQLFTTPYLVEFEDGFIYNNELILCDALGNLYTPDIFGQNAIGGYSDYNITRSNTDVLLFNTPTRLTIGSNNSFNFEKVMTFINQNTNTDIGTVGSHFESLTLYFAYASSQSVSAHLLHPCNVLCYKTLRNSGLKNDNNADVIWLVNKWSGDYLDVWNNKVEKVTVFGTVEYGGGDSVPTIIINPDKNIITQNINDGTTTIIDGTSITVNLYLLKIVGHRKVGKGY